MKKLNMFLLLFWVISVSTAFGEEVVEGHYISAFERSEFIPCGSAEKWWLEGGVFAELEKFIEDNSLRGDQTDWLPNKAFYVKLVGEKSEIGDFGHRGAYDRELIAIRLVDASVTNKCK